MMRFAHRKDIFIIFAFILISLFLWSVLSNNKAQYAEIVYDGTVVAEVKLEGNKTFSVPEVTGVTFEIKNGAIAFIESDCPDKVCINEGYIKSGVAACLPNKLILRVTNDNSGIDAVVR